MSHLSTEAKAITINIVPLFLKKHKVKIIIVALILIGTFLRFYNLNWGAPFYFHPDERNIVSLVLNSSLADTTSLLKGTFAYGNFPVILALLLKPFFTPVFNILKVIDPFSQTVIILRFISASFSVLTLFIIYLAGKFWSEKVGLLSLFLATFSTGLIQQAHFGTYDGFVAFCAVTIFYFSLRFLKTKTISSYYLALFFLGIGTAAKVNLLIFLLPILTILSVINNKKRINLLYIIKHSVIGIILLLFLTAILSPYYLRPEFFSSLFYERGLVAGVLPVFYTQSFYDTTPVVFQLLHILPFLINPLLTIIFIPAFFYLLYKGIKTKSAPLLILTSCFLILFLPQAFLFAKWTRYMVPTLPFIYLIIALAISNFFKVPGKVLSIKYLVFGIFLTVNFIFGISYFITAFIKPDTRAEAAKFAQLNIPQKATILSEPYDLGLTPFNNFSNIGIFNFYDLDSDPSLQDELRVKLAQSDYIILPSQRLLRSRLLNKNKFPKGYSIYSLLFNEALGYQKIYESPCDIFCQITYLGNPIFGFEETATVFDRPTVFIFKKIQ